MRHSATGFHPMHFLRQQPQQQQLGHPLQSLQSVAVSAGAVAPHAPDDSVSAASALCFCPLHRGFHNSWTVYGVGPDGAVHFNPLMGRDFAK